MIGCKTSHLLEMELKSSSCFENRNIQNFHFFSPALYKVPCNIVHNVCLFSPFIKLEHQSSIDIIVDLCDKPKRKSKWLWSKLLIYLFVFYLCENAFIPSELHVVSIKVCFYINILCALHVTATFFQSCSKHQLARDRRWKLVSVPKLHDRLAIINLCALSHYYITLETRQSWLDSKWKGKESQVGQLNSLQDS